MTSGLILPILLTFPLAAPDAGAADLTRATVVMRKDAPPAEATAVAVLVEEAEARTGVKWPVSIARPAAGPVIVAASALDDVTERAAPAAVQFAAGRLKPEGFVLS